VISSTAWRCPPSVGSDDDATSHTGGAATDALADAEALANYRALLAARAFDFDTSPLRPEPVLKLGGKTISTPGNLTAVQALAKAGKTAVVGGILAAVMAGNDTGCDTLGFSSLNLDCKALLHFDTEQSRFDHHQLIRRSIKRARVGRTPPWFSSHCLADLDEEERVMCIEVALADAAEAHGGVLMVVIDGVADLCMDPNDSREAFGLVRRLHAKAIELDCAIITVLHENPGSVSGKMRGHLGSQLERKAETALRLQKNATTGVTTIWAECARNCHMPKSEGTYFVWDDDQGMHASCARIADADASEQRTKLLHEATCAFGAHVSLGYMDLVAAIMKSAGLKVDAAKKRVASYVAEGIAEKSQDKSYSLKNSPRCIGV